MICFAAPVYGFFGTLKEEFYNGRDWSQVGFDEFKERLDAYIEW